MVNSQDKFSFIAIRYIISFSSSDCKLGSVYSFFYEAVCNDINLLTVIDGADKIYLI